jgi:hypothetical protein
MIATCPSCTAMLPHQKMRCERCGTWVLQSLTSGEAKEDDFIDAVDVEGESVARITTGGPWDIAWGGGFVPTSITLLGGAPGAGKALALDTPIPTSKGWTTMGKVKPGDVLFDERGEPCTVLACSQVMRGRECYEVEFADGEKIVADGEHLWHTFTKLERTAALRRTDPWRSARRETRESRGRGLRKKRDEYNPNLARFSETHVSASGAVRTTVQIASSLKYGVHLNHSIALTTPLVLPEADLPVSPYVLGVWLGDGHSASGRYSSDDPEIADFIRSEGYEVSKRSHDFLWQIYDLQPSLRKLGVLGDKHIPEVYLRSSISQRLQLLQGLMDTDGTCTPNGSECDFDTTSVKLRDGVDELLASLGVKAHATSRRMKLNGKDVGESWRFCFSTRLPVFRLPRKAVRQHRQHPRGVHLRRYIARVDRAASVPVRCIAVSSPSRLYLAGRKMVPTHNTTMLLQLSVLLAANTKRPTYYVSAEQDKGELKLTLDRLNLPLLRGQLKMLKKFGAGASISESTFKADPPGMIILDSISALCGKDTHRQIDVCKCYKQYAVKYKAPTFIIAHMTKEHDFSGLMTLQHEVDTLVTLFPEDDGRRSLKAWKNRFGPTHAEYYLVMTETGLQAIPPKPEKKPKKDKDKDKDRGKDYPPAHKVLAAEDKSRKKNRAREEAL